MSMQQNTYIGHKNIDILKLLTGLMFIGLMNVLLSMELVSRENGPLQDQKINQRRANAQGLPHCGEQMKQMFWVLSLVLYVELV